MLQHSLGHRRRFARAVAATIALTSFSVLTATAQNYEGPQPPIIDVHVHGSMGAQPTAQPMCPNEPGFAASDPATQESANGWVKVACSNPIVPVPPAEYLKQVGADMKRLNVTAVVFGDAASTAKYEEAAPGRIIPGTSFNAPGRDATFLPIEQVEAAFATGKFKVMGEIGLQSRGYSPSDPSLDKYFALAEKLDIPVAIHMGTGGSGRANITMPKFRGSLGDPLLLNRISHVVAGVMQAHRTEQAQLSMSGGYRDTEMVANYHNGPLSIILPFGIFGLLLIRHAIRSTGQGSLERRCGRVPGARTRSGTLSRFARRTQPPGLVPRQSDRETGNSD